MDTQESAPYEVLLVGLSLFFVAFRLWKIGRDPIKTTNCMMLGAVVGGVGILVWLLLTTTTDVVIPVMQAGSGILILFAVSTLFLTRSSVPPDWMKQSSRTVLLPLIVIAILVGYGSVMISFWLIMWSLWLAWFTWTVKTRLGIQLSN